LVDRTRVSMNGVDGLDPVGGVHRSVTFTVALVTKLMIGSDPGEIENHDPIESDPD